MDALTVLIVDDEPLAREILEGYVRRTPDLTLVASCKNALDAFSILSRQAVDVLLLDINMPEINGMELLQTLKNPPPVIFTTAYAEFAVVSYEHNAIDYLLKPVSFERFLRAVDKLRDLKQRQQQGSAAGSSFFEQDILFVRSEGKLVKIDLTQLVFIEGLKDYLRLWTEQGKLIMHATMKNMEEQLTKRSNFIRVNKSFIVNIHYIREVDGNAIKIQNQVIPIGTTYREQVHELFNKYKLL
ncbi:MAG TPA: LytTR family DNA-binding domain-containing protein [Flavipsychrobacter sp.]|nr:LytTR family DNA-binding domain-containing protein [Flavipsychrobacter sp.]